MSKNVKKLYEGDPRCEQLVNALLDVVYERGARMPIPSILGVIELVKIQILKDSE